jgi:hypothetical protein
MRRGFIKGSPILWYIGPGADTSLRNLTGAVVGEVTTMHIRMIPADLISARAEIGLAALRREIRLVEEELNRRAKRSRPWQM